MWAVRVVEIGFGGRDWVLVDLGANVLSCESMAWLAGQSIVVRG